MKGDYIYCLNPSCHILFKDIDDVLETRDKYKAMCPKCGSTNTINASEELYDWKPRRILYANKRKDVTPMEIKQYALHLQSIGAIKTFKLHKRQNRSRETLLYDTTNYKTDIIAQALKQEVFITYEKQAKPLNKRMPKLPKVEKGYKPKKPDLSNETIAKEVLGIRTRFDLRHTLTDGEIDETFCNEPPGDSEQQTNFDSPETRDNQLNKKAKPKTRKQTYEGWKYDTN